MSEGPLPLNVFEEDCGNDTRDRSCLLSVRLFTYALFIPLDNNFSQSVHNSNTFRRQIPKIVIANQDALGLDTCAFIWMDSHGSFKFVNQNSFGHGFGYSFHFDCINLPETIINHDGADTCVCEILKFKLVQNIALKFFKWNQLDFIVVIRGINRFHSLIVVEKSHLGWLLDIFLIHTLILVIWNHVFKTIFLFHWAHIYIIILRLWISEPSFIYTVHVEVVTNVVFFSVGFWG